MGNYVKFERRRETKSNLKGEELGVCNNVKINFEVVRDGGKRVVKMKV